MTRTPAPALSPAEAARVAAFDAAPVLPEIVVIKRLLDVADSLDGWQRNAAIHYGLVREDPVQSAAAVARALAYQRASDAIHDALDGKP